jgi:hypothetical protein
MTIDRHLIPIALVGLACVFGGCTQDVVPEPLPLSSPWAVDIALDVPEPLPVAQSVPEPQPVDKAPGPSPGPADKSAIALDCSGLLLGWNNCMLMASRTCGARGYTILGRSDQDPLQPKESAFTRSMRIRCNS